MTIGEYIRASGDEELGALLFSWLTTFVTILGADMSKLDFQSEYMGILDYLQKPVETVEDDLKRVITLFMEPSDLMS